MRDGFGKLGDRPELLAGHSAVRGARRHHAHRPADRPDGPFWLGGSSIVSSWIYRRAADPRVGRSPARPRAVELRHPACRWSGWWAVNNQIRKIFIIVLLMFALLGVGITNTQFISRLAQRRRSPSARFCTRPTTARSSLTRRRSHLRSARKTRSATCAPTPRAAVRAGHGLLLVGGQRVDGRGHRGGRLDGQSEPARWRLRNL